MVRFVSSSDGNIAIPKPLQRIGGVRRLSRTQRGIPHGAVKVEKLTKLVVGSPARPLLAAVLQKPAANGDDGLVRLIRSPAMPLPFAYVW